MAVDKLRVKLDVEGSDDGERASGEYLILVFTVETQEKPDLHEISHLHNFDVELTDESAYLCSGNETLGKTLILSLDRGQRVALCLTEDVEWAGTKHDLKKLIETELGMAKNWKRAFDSERCWFEFRHLVEEEEEEI